MEWELRSGKRTMFSSSGMDISNRSHNFKQMQKAEKWRQEKLEREFMKKLKKQEEEDEKME